MSERHVSPEDKVFAQGFVKPNQELLYCSWTKFTIMKKPKEYLLVITSMRFIQGRTSLLRRSVRKNIPIVSLAELNVVEKSGTCKLLLRFNSDEDVFHVKTNIYIATQIVQAILYSSLRATYLFPHLPEVRVSPKFRKGFVHPKLSARQALVHSYAVACDELDIAERPAVACGLQQTTAEVLNLRQLFFPGGGDVASHPLPQNDIQALATALRFTSCFKEVVGTSIPLADDGVRALSTAVLGNKNIEAISFVDCKVTSGSTMNQIGQTIKNKRPRLRLMNFGNNPKLQDSGISALAVGLGQAHIDQLYLNKCAFRTKGYKALCRSLSFPNLAGPNGLKVLNISDNHAGKNGSKALAAWLSKAEALEVLTLVRTDIDAATVLGAIKTNIKLSKSVLKQLNVSGCRLHDAGAQVLGSLLSSTESMSRVFLQSTKLSPDQFDYIIHGACTNPSASTGTGVQFVLDFSSNGLEANAGKILGSNLKQSTRSIETLILSHNNFREAGIIAVCKSLVHLKSLKTLVVDKNVKASTFSNGNPELGKALVRLCQQLPTLETLSINGADDTVYNVKNGLNPLLENLAKNKTLTRLSINRNGLTDSELKLISISLKTNSSLRVIDIDHNKSTYVGLKEYIRVVKKSTSLWEACPRNDILQAAKLKKSYELEMRLGLDEMNNRLLANRERSSPEELTKAGLVRQSRSGSAYAPSSMNLQEEKKEKTPEEIELELEKPRGDQFGVELVDLIGTTKVRYHEGRIPTVLCRMFDYLVNHGGVETVGIFRLAPDADESNLVQKQFDQGNFKGCSDVNSVANCIKVWFRQLPTPLLNNLDKKAVATASTPELASQVVATIKEPEKSLLNWLFDCNVTIARNEAVNKMSPRNLAIVFVPNLFQIDNLDPLESLHFSEKVSRLFENAVIARKEWRAKKDVEEVEQEKRDDEERVIKEAEEARAEAERVENGGSDEEESKDETYYDDEDDDEDDEEEDDILFEQEKEEFDKEKLANLKQINQLIRTLRREQIKLGAEIQMNEIEEEPDEDLIEDLQIKMNEIKAEIKRQTERKKEVQAREFEAPEYNADDDQGNDSDTTESPRRFKQSQPPPPSGRPPMGRPSHGRMPRPPGRGPPPPGRRRPPPPGRGPPPSRRGQPPPPRGQPPGGHPPGFSKSEKYTVPAGQPPPPAGPRPSVAAGMAVRGIIPPYSPHQPPPPSQPRPSNVPSHQPPPPRQPPPAGARRPPTPRRTNLSSPAPQPHLEEEEYDVEEEEEYDVEEEFEYDESGNVIEYQTLYDIDGIELEYDEEGMLLSEQPYDDEGTPIQGFDEEGQPVYYEQQYDEDGNPIDGYDEDGNPVYPQEYDEDGNPIQGYDEDGNPVYYDEEEEDEDEEGENAASSEYYDEDEEDDELTLTDMLSGNPNDEDDDDDDDDFENDESLTEEEKEDRRKNKVRERLRKQREQVGGAYQGGFFPQLNIHALIAGGSMKPLKRVDK